MIGQKCRGNLVASIQRFGGLTEVNSRKMFFVILKWLCHPERYLAVSRVTRKLFSPTGGILSVFWYKYPKYIEVGSISAHHIVRSRKFSEVT